MMYSLLSQHRFSFKILTSVCGCKTVSLSPVGLFWNRVGFGGVSGEWAGRGRVSPEEVAAQCGLGDMGADALQGVEEVDLDSSTSRPTACKVTRSGWILSPLTQPVAAVGLQST